MPTQVVNDTNSSGNSEIKVKIAYNGEIMIIYINEKITYDELSAEIRGICRFPPDQVKYIKKKNKIKLEHIAHTHTVNHIQKQ